MKRLVLFDLDGTLLNTLEDLANAGNHLLAAHGYPIHPVDSYRHFVGNGVLKLVERILPEGQRGDAARVAALRDEFNAYYQAHKEEQTRPYPEVPDLLAQLKGRGVAMAVLSNKPDPFTKALCSRWFPGCFQIVHGQREGFPIKPDPLLPRQVLEEAEVPSEEALYLGDSGVDMQTARNGGIFALGALWGFRDAPELLENGADALLRRPTELLDYL